MSDWRTFVGTEDPNWSSLTPLDYRRFRVVDEVVEVQEPVMLARFNVAVSAAQLTDVQALALPNEVVLFEAYSGYSDSSAYIMAYVWRDTELTSHLHARIQHELSFD